MSTLDPRAWNVGRNSGCFLRSVSGFTFPLLTKALVVSQPVNACRATRARLISSPRSLATAWTFTSRRLSPVPVSNSTVWFIWRTNLRSKMNTSVSGDLTSITELSGELVAASLQCKIILVSASSCEEHNFSTSSVTTLFPSILFKLMHSLSLTKTKCFPRSFGAYFSFSIPLRGSCKSAFCFLHYARTFSSQEEL